MKNKILAVMIAAAFLLAAGSTHAAKSAFDYTGKSYGLQLDFGMGFTGGVDKKLVKDPLGVDVGPKNKMTLRFGASGLIRIVEGLYARPFVQVAFYHAEVDLTKYTDNQGNPLDKLKGPMTHISFGVVPTYYFRFVGSPVHPFAGVGIKLHYNKLGDADIYWKDGTKEKFLKGDSKFGFGISPTIGAEFQIGKKIGIPLAFQYDLVFTDAADVLTIMTGCAVYF